MNEDDNRTLIDKELIQRLTNEARQTQEACEDELKAIESRPNLLPIKVTLSNNDTVLAEVGKLKLITNNDGLKQEIERNV